MVSFNVLTEPWIPALDKEGSVEEYGLLPLLEKAPYLDGIVDPAPPIQFGLYRLVVAFLMDALDLREPEQLVALLEAEGFDLDAIHRYVESVGPQRFDLFDPETPFLQAATEDAKPKPVANLLPHLPSGTFAIHFHHWREGDHAFSPAACARALTAIAPFMTAGGAGYSPSINGIPPWYVLVRGKNLFEALLLNCYVGETPALRGEEGPAWRATKPVVPKQSAHCESLLEGLTWRPRMVRLIPSEGGICTYTGKHSPVLVREMLWGPGLAFVGQESWRDPNAAYVYTAKGRSPLRPQEERELWRDTGPLLLLRREVHGAGESKVAFDRPWVVDQLHRLREDYDLFPKRRWAVVEAYGMRTDGKMKVFEWQYERLDVPAGVLQNRLAPALVRTATEMAESGAWCLKEGLTKAYPRDGEGNQKAFARLIQEAQRQYWSDLRPRFRAEILEAVASMDPEEAEGGEALLDRWGKTVRQVASDRFEEVMGPLDADAQALIRQVEARETFRALLFQSVVPPAERARQMKQKRRAVSHGG